MGFFIGYDSSVTSPKFPKPRLVPLFRPLELVVHSTYVLGKHGREKSRSTIFEYITLVWRD